MISLTNLTLGKKITLLTILGLLVGVGVFSTIGMRAVNQATETMLQDRLTTARLVADYINESLTRALNEVEKTAAMINIDSPEEAINRQIDALEENSSRLSIHTRSIYLIDPAGRVRWSRPEVPGLSGQAAFSGLDFRREMNGGAVRISS